MFVTLEVIVAQQIGSQTPLLILREKGGTRTVACEIESSMLREIFIALHNVDEKRAGTHALWSRLTQNCNAQIERFTLHALDDEGALNCSLLIQCGDRSFSMQCGLYTGIALALHHKAPILCAESVFVVISAGTDVNIIEEPATKDIAERLWLFSATHDDIPKA